MISRIKSNDDQSMDFEEDYSDYYTDIEKNNDEEMDTKSGKSKQMECNDCSISSAKLF